MRLQPISPAEFEFCKELYNESLDMCSSSVFQADMDSMWVNALQNPASLWRVAMRGDEPVGLAGLEKMNLVDRTCEPFIAIKRELRRQGLGLEMGKLLFRFAVQNLGIRRVESCILENAPSRAVLEKLGFYLEGTQKQARFYQGEYVNTMRYAWVREM